MLRISINREDKEQSNLKTKDSKIPERENSVRRRDGKWSGRAGAWKKHIALSVFTFVHLRVCGGVFVVYLLCIDSPITNAQKYLSIKVLVLDSGNLGSNSSDCVAVGKSCVFLMSGFPFL